MQARSTVLSFFWLSMMVLRLGARQFLSAHQPCGPNENWLPVPMASHAQVGHPFRIAQIERLEAQGPLPNRSSSFPTSCRGSWDCRRPT